MILQAQFLEDITFLAFYTGSILWLWIQIQSFHIVVSILNTDKTLTKMLSSSTTLVFYCRYSPTTQHKAEKQ